MEPAASRPAPSARPAAARAVALAAVARLAPLAAEPARRGGPVAVIDRGSPCAFLGVPFVPPAPNRGPNMAPWRSPFRPPTWRDGLGDTYAGGLTPCVTET